MCLHLAVQLSNLTLVWPLCKDREIRAAKHWNWTKNLFLLSPCLTLSSGSRNLCRRHTGPGPKRIYVTLTTFCLGKIPARPLRAIKIILETLSVFNNQRRKWPWTYRMGIKSDLGELIHARLFNGMNEGPWYVPLSPVCTRITRGTHNSHKKEREKTPSNFREP